MSAPCSLSSAAWPTRSTPTTRAKWPAWPAATPAWASSKTTACAAGTPSASAAARNVSGAGLPRRPRSLATTPSILTSNRSSMPAESSTCWVLALAETIAVRMPLCPYRLDVGDAALVHLDAAGRDLRQDQVVLAVAQPVQGGRPRRVVRGALGQVDAAGLQERPGSVQPWLAVDVGVVLVVRVEGNELGPGALGAFRGGTRRTFPSTPRRATSRSGSPRRPCQTGRPKPRQEAPTCAPPPKVMPGSPACPLEPPGPPWPVPRC